MIDPATTPVIPPPPPPVMPSFAKPVAPLSPATTLGGQLVQSAPVTAGDAPQSAETRAQISILLVEDDTVLQELYFDRFSRSGLRVLQAFDGQEAIEMIQQHTEINLILLDLMLPKLSGFDVLMQIRKVLKLEVPVVVVSALSDIDDQARSLQLGANEYITKGEVLPSTVIEKIHHYATGVHSTPTGGGNTAVYTPASGLA